MQAHIWEFDLAAGAFDFNGELRQVGLDTGLIPAYGAIFMDLQDLSAMRTSKLRCPKTDEVLSTRSVRRGVLRGSMTFLPGYVDPQFPDDVSITHVRATIERTRYTGNNCVYGNPCEPGKVLTGTQATGVGARRIRTPPGTDHPDVPLPPDAMTALDALEAAMRAGRALPNTAPFIDPGGSMSWTKGTKEVDVGPRCRRTSWQLTMPTGSLEARLDSGDQTLAAPATAGLEIEARR